MMSKKFSKSNVKTFFKVMKYLKKYRIHFILSLLFTAISVGLTLYIPILVGKCIDLAVGSGNVSMDEIGSILFKMAVAILITALLQWLINILNNQMTFGIVKNIRYNAFVRIQKLPISYIDKHQTGEIVSRVITDSEQFSDGLLMGFTQFFNGILTILCTLVFMVVINFWIALIVVIITPLSLFVASFIAKKTYSMFKLQSEIRGEQTAYIDEMINNHKVVVAFEQEKQVQRKFDEINDRLSKASLRAIFFSSTTNPATRFVNALVYAFVAFFGAVVCIGGNGILTIGMLSSFLSYATQYTKPFNEISGVVTEIQSALACAARVFELIEAPIPENEGELTSIDGFKGNIAFENVSFSYTEAKPLIENFNLDVKQGQHIAIVGPTGCGKTTLINLLMRFYNVRSGAITVDGININDISKKALRDSYGMVLQETWLFGGTIRENIAFGKPDATDDEIIAAAKKAHAHGFIRRLPDGYSTLISEDGGILSQGQKQLLCIARIMLRDPSILILDEATSSIDTRTEIKIQKAFATAMEGRTSFIVAHRLSTIKEADVILVMNNGNIVEQGNHSELLDKKGFYFDLYNSQFPTVEAN